MIVYIRKKLSLYLKPFCGFIYVVVILCPKMKKKKEKRTM